MTANEMLRKVRGHAREQLEVLTTAGEHIVGTLHSWSGSSLWLLVSDEDRLVRYDTIVALGFEGQAPVLIPVRV